MSYWKKIDNKIISNCICGSGAAKHFETHTHTHCCKYLTTTLFWGSSRIVYFILFLLAQLDCTIPLLHQPRRKTMTVCTSWRLVTEVIKALRALAACSRQVMLLPCAGCALPARSTGVSASQSHEHFNVTGCTPHDNKRWLHSARTEARAIMRLAVSLKSRLLDSSLFVCFYPHVIGY